MNEAMLAVVLPESIPPVVYYLALLVTLSVAIYGVVVLVRNSRAGAAQGKEKRAAAVGNSDDAAIAAAIAATLVVMDDEATVAAITAAITAYLEEECKGKSSLPTGFRVVSFRRRGGAWNRVSK